MTHRILVCGSRSWNDRELLAHELGAVLARINSSNVLIVHGDCPTGADRMASEWCVEHGLPQEKHPADWAQFKNAAGPMRNEEMAALGARLCLAFWSARSRGTLDMISRATDHGIKTSIVPGKSKL